MIHSQSWEPLLWCDVLGGSWKPNSLWFSLEPKLASAEVTAEGFSLSVCVSPSLSLSHPLGNEGGDAVSHRQNPQGPQGGFFKIPNPRILSFSTITKYLPPIWGHNTGLHESLLNFQKFKSLLHRALNNLNLKLNSNFFFFLLNRELSPNVLSFHFPSKNHHCGESIHSGTNPDAF